jgi:hypothetical protein
MPISTTEGSTYRGLSRRISKLEAYKMHRSSHVNEPVDVDVGRTGEQQDWNLA